MVSRTGTVFFHSVGPDVSDCFGKAFYFFGLMKKHITAADIDKSYICLGRRQYDDRRTRVELADNAAQADVRHRTKITVDNKDIEPRSQSDIERFTDVL